MASPSTASIAREDQISDAQTDIYISSPAMQRTILVHVLHPSHSAPRPSFYLLDGNEARYEQSDWIAKTSIVEFASTKNVNVVLPAGGEGSHYTDWQQTDPKFGVYKWETFLAEELPPIIDARFNGNGRNAIGGTSMGGQAAFTLATRNPELFRGAIGISACPLVAPEPYQNSVRAGIASRGGDATNMWGPRDAPGWFEHDPAQNLDALRGKPIYLYAGSGAPGIYETQVDDAQETVTVGGPIEAAALVCSTDFAARLIDEGIIPTVDFRSSGTHSWPYWNDAIRSAWPTVEAAVGGP
ncbi:esterase family protein [Hoyosella rhizosphaerae]|uniref:Esterase family protein n=2 Tax=Hoyosella rhizosphaerae TaxID=1755582 RepID=A0A916TZV8_9ACTN|nr:esterase family protein [Hoyosella rhizosphaerae]GGC53326.1 hypothetical protein GCM10011410_02080 [Hoyosella rhizosphaerae]